MRIKKSTLFEYIFVITISILFTLFNSIHVITQWLSNAPDRLYAGIAHYYADYFLYLSQFSQGADGKWIFAEHRFTNEIIRPTWIYWFNLLLGWIGRRIGLNPFQSYNISLLILVFLLLILWYKLTSCIHPKDRFKRIYSWFIILSASSFFKFDTFFQSGRIEFAEQYWFSPHMAFVRLGGVPHQIFQTILFLLLVLIIGKTLSQFHNSQQLNNRTIQQLCIIGILTFLATTSNPQQMMIFLIALGVLFICRILKHLYGKQIHTIWKSFLEHNNELKIWIVMIGVLTFISILAVILTLIEFRLPVFEYARNWEMTIPVDVPIWQFLYLIGPAIIFIPFGVYQFMKNTDVIGKLYFLYGITSILIFFSPIPKLLNGPSPRFLHPAPYGLLGILAVEGIVWLSQILQIFFYKLTSKSYTLVPAFYIFHFSVYILFTLPALYSQISSRANPDIQNPVMLLTTDWNHIPKDTVDALYWLKKEPDNGRPVVMMDSKWRMEILVPVLSDKISFSGHPLHTMFFKDKEILRDTFFDTSMSENDIQKIMDDHRIGWIMVSQKTNPRGYFDKMQFLKRAFENASIIIYSYSK